MKRNPVTSKNLKSVGYDETTRLLEVEFLRDKSIYQYSCVPLTVYNDLMLAKSIGGYFSEHIRDNLLFGCRQIFPILRLLRGQFPECL